MIGFNFKILTHDFLYIQPHVYNNNQVTFFLITAYLLLLGENERMRGNYRILNEIQECMNAYCVYFSRYNKIQMLKEYGKAYLFISSIFLNLCVNHSSTI